MFFFFFSVSRKRKHSARGYVTRVERKRKRNRENVSTWKYCKLIQILILRYTFTRLSLNLVVVKIRTWSIAVQVRDQYLYTTTPPLLCCLLVIDSVIRKEKTDKIEFVDAVFEFSKTWGKKKVPSNSNKVGAVFARAVYLFFLFIFSNSLQTVYHPSKNKNKRWNPKIQSF